MVKKYVRLVLYYDDTEDEEIILIGKFDPFVPNMYVPWRGSPRLPSKPYDFVTPTPNGTM